MEFIADSIGSAWELSIHRLLSEVSWVPTQRGLRTIELTNVVFRIKNPLSDPVVSSKYAFSKEFIENYCNSIRDNFPGDSIKSRLYDYAGKIDQIALITKELKKEWFTRRAVASLWQPDVDIGSTHPPCTIFLQFMFRDNRLHLSTVLRSNDAWMAALPDMIAFSQLQERVANDLKVSVGQYTQMSVSYHMYEPDIIIAKEAFRNAV